MSRKLIFAAVLALAPLPALPVLAATPAALQEAQSPTMPGPDNVMGRGGKGGRLAAFLSPEQRAMLLLQARDQIKALTPDERKTWRKDQVRKVMAMSPADRQKFKLDLQAKWDALPQGQKDRIQQRLASRENRPNGAQ